MLGIKNQILKNLQPRYLIPQVLLIIIFAGIIYYFTNNAGINMKARNISSGFDFLNTNSGFDVQFSLIPYSGSSSYGTAYLVGLLNTLLVAFIGIIFATIIGFIIGISRLSNNWLLNKFAAIYVELFRNLPLILQIFFWYFAVLRALPETKDSITFFSSVFINLQGIYIPKFIFKNFHFITYGFVIALITIFLLSYFSKKLFYEKGIAIPVFKYSLLIIILLPIVFALIGGTTYVVEYPLLKKNYGIANFVGGVKLVPEFIALALSLSVYTAAFIAENVRAGILAISKGQKEAAKSLGFNNSQSLKLIIIPQALRVIIPPTTNQYLNLTKNSSLAAAIGYPDLTGVFAGTSLSQTGKAIEIIFIVMMTYLTISLFISLLLNWYNKKIALVEK